MEDKENNNNVETLRPTEERPVQRENIDEGVQNKKKIIFLVIVVVVMILIKFFVLNN